MIGVYASEDHVRNPKLVSVFGSMLFHFCDNSLNFLLSLKEQLGVVEKNKVGVFFYFLYSAADPFNPKLMAVIITPPSSPHQSPSLQKAGYVPLKLIIFSNFQRSNIKPPDSIRIHTNKNDFTLRLSRLALCL